MLDLRPIIQKDAFAFVREHHRHHGVPVGCLWVHGAQDDDGEVQEDWLTDLIKTALRQREQETAADAAKMFWESVRDRLGLAHDQRVYSWHDVVDACEAASLSVLSRFPKDQGGAWPRSTPST